MDLLCLALVLVGAGMALVVAVMLGVTQRAGRQAITRNFQDAEYILAHHSAPPVLVKSVPVAKALAIAGQREAHSRGGGKAPPPGRARRLFRAQHLL